ncbi:MAG TPA: NADH-quinone oxidoreductase subunit I [Patescibacteria group bacterium]|jgi:NADH-quinone oxidoreductase subunit I|nr:NADH-quinone oxidoreductase subunit I [Patescibacteria group bacterium]
MSLVVDRRLSLLDRLYLPGIFRGMRITLKHLFKRKFTMQYPEQRWTFPDGFRGVPALVKDQEGRVKCVACYLCQFVCPPKAITIVAGEMPGNKVEKFPAEFDINMLRCIYCGMCEEVCPEQAIFLTGTYEVAGAKRTDLIFNKARLLEIGGVRTDPIMKWAQK